MPRLVRQAPLAMQLKTYLDPWDWFLWLAEELNDDAYDEWLKQWAAPIGIGLNLAFILAKGVSSNGSAGSAGNDDVFGDFERKSTGWMTRMATLCVYSLAAGCCLNALYTFFRHRHYRLFEHPIDVSPETTSARRVKVDSAPVSSSPLRYLQRLVSEATAQSRAYPDPEREVWELRVWDPKPINLTIFTYFSPGHLALYFALLPPNPSDPRPSVAVATAIFFAALLSLQLTSLKISFAQQAKDSSLIHGEVMSEYDVKFVRPLLNRPVRDVATQTLESSLTPKGTRSREVDTYTPTTIVRRGFEIHPNRNYALHYDPNNASSQTDAHQKRPSTSSAFLRKISTSSLLTPRASNSENSGSPTGATGVSSVASTAEFSSPLKPHHERPRERSSLSGEGSGASSYSSYGASPLRKSISANHLISTSGRMTHDENSPVKRSNVTGWSGQSGQGRQRETGRY